MLQMNQRFNSDQIDAGDDKYLYSLKPQCLSVVVARLLRTKYRNWKSGLAFLQTGH